MPTVKAKIEKYDVWEDADITRLTRIDVDGDTATQADISSISYSVYVDDTKALIDSGDIDVATSIFDTLQTDGRWSRDAIGYNFRYSFDSSLFASGNVYRIEIRFQLAGGKRTWDIFRLKALEVLSM